MGCADDYVKVNFVVALVANMITPSDFDDVSCLVCGVAPKVVYTDGNSKVRKVK